ncbi:hypothetical protein RPALISO_118 [Ruegeria phage RpAliso]|nr:hypothetical protein RPALISO_118 [Ruegeria phage RpAliso]
MATLDETAVFGSLGGYSGLPEELEEQIKNDPLVLQQRHAVPRGKDAVHLSIGDRSNLISWFARSADGTYAPYGAVMVLCEEVAA